MKKRSIKKVFTGLMLGSAIIAPMLSLFINKNNMNVVNNTMFNSNSKGASALGISQKVDLNTNFANMYAGEIAHSIVSFDESNKNETWEKLSKFFNGITDDIKTNNTAKKIRTSFNSTIGLVNISFVIYNDANNAIEGQVNGTWTLTKQGVTEITNSYYKVINKTTNDLYAILTSNDNGQIKSILENNILANLPQNPEFTISTDNVIYDNVNQKITIKELTLSNAITDTNVEQKTFGPFVIVGNDNNEGSTDPIKTSKLIPINTYLTDPLFSNANDAQGFVDLLTAHKTEANYIDKIVKKENIPDDATIEIKKVIVSDQSANVIFKVSKYIDSDGVIANKEITINYNVFPLKQSVETVVSKNIVLTAKGSSEYAYQYTTEQLANVINEDINGSQHSIVMNPVSGSIATVSINSINNKTGIIDANVSLSSATNNDGSQQQNKEFTNIYFVAPKMINQPTTLIRNTTPIDDKLTINKLDEAIASDSSNSYDNTYALIEKYFSIVGNKESDSSFEITNIKKNSHISRSSETIETAASYKITTKIKKGFAFDDKYSFYEEKDGFVVYLNININEPTVLKDTIKTNGIAANMTNETLMSITADDFAAGKHNQVLKDWITTNFNNIFDNLSTDSNFTPSIEDSNFSVIKKDDKTITVTMTMNNAVTFEGYGQTEFTFDIIDLLAPINTVLVKDIDFSTTETSLYASVQAASTDWLKKTIFAEITKTNNAVPNENYYGSNAYNTNYFNGLPTNPSLTFDKINVLNINGNDGEGKITCLIQLPAYYSKGIKYVKDGENLDQYENHLVNYQVTVSGFKKINHKFTDLSTTIDANNGQMNESINDKILVNAFDYKEAIKNNILDFLNTNANDNFLPSEIVTIKNYINGNFINDSSWTLSIAASSTRSVTNCNALVTVINHELAKISKDSNWSSGINFTINNANYAISEINTTLTEKMNITLKEFEYSLASTPLISLEDFGLTTNYVPASTYADASYNSYNNNVKVGIVNGNNDTGKAQLKITFPDGIYTDNLTLTPNYEYIFDFQFKPAIPDVDYLNTSIDATKTNADSGKHLSDYTANQLLQYFNDATNKNAINKWIENNKNIFYAPSAPKEPLHFEQALLSPTQDAITLVISIGDPIFKREKITITNLKTFEATNPTLAQQEIPADLTFDGLDDYDFVGNASKFIRYNQGTTPVDNKEIKIISTKVDYKFSDDVTQKAYVDFTFNGIYLQANDINSYVANYTIKIELIFKSPTLAPGTTLMRFITNDTLAPNNKQIDWLLWVAIAGGSLLLLLLLIALIIYLYKRTRKYKSR